MAEELGRMLGQLARRDVHVTRRRLLRVLAGTGLGMTGLARLARSGRVAAADPPPANPHTQHGVEPRGLSLVQKDRTREGRFGLMFKKLPAYAPPDELLAWLGHPDRMRELDPNDTGQDNLSIPAGFTFLGQFIDHDITFDTTPLTEQQADPDAVTNFRSARYDLDSVYGLGPATTPQFYDPNDRAKLLITTTNYPNFPPGTGLTARVDDVPRGSDGKAIIPDPRNDQNLIVVQIHLAVMKFHNKMVEHLRAQGVPAAQVFEEARRLTRWHFQWVVIDDFLPRVIGQSMVDQILIEKRPGLPAKVKLDFYKPKNPNRPMMPAEFAGAAYRFGHSMIRPAYTVSSLQGPKVPFFGQQAGDNLNGSRAIPPKFVIQWHFLFAGIKPEPNLDLRRARQINGRLAFSLFDMPPSVVPPPHVSLAERNLLRGKRLGLPSGQRVAQEMGVPALANGDLGLADSRWEGQAPLWFYILKEAEIRHGGQQLGAVGGRIVGEVLLGLLEKDKNSFLRQDPHFRPAPPIAPAVGTFKMADLLKFAGVALP